MPYRIAPSIFGFCRKMQRRKLFDEQQAEDERLGYLGGGCAANHMFAAHAGTLVPVIRNFLFAIRS